MTIRFTSWESRSSTTMTCCWFGNVHSSCTAQFINLIEFHSTRSLYLHLSGCISKVLWMLIFFLIICIGMMLIWILFMTWHSLEFSYLHVLLLLLLVREITISIMTISSLACCLCTGSSRASMLSTSRFLSRWWNLSFACTRGYALFYWLLSLLSCILQLLSFDSESLADNTTDLIVLWAFKLLDNDL